MFIYLAIALIIYGIEATVLQNLSLPIKLTVNTLLVILFVAIVILKEKSNFKQLIAARN
jgi:hypothetical protein